MKRKIKKSTTITETIVNDNGETFIVDRQHNVESNSKLITDITDGDLEYWKKQDQIYRQEIAKEWEEHKKKNNLN